MIALLGFLAGAVAAPWWGFVDLRVYLFGGSVALDGRPLYVAMEPHTDLLFTYPPFAAVAMAPASLLPWWLAVSAMVAASVTALGLTLRTFGAPTYWLVPLTAAAVALLSLIHI